jgi:hypothetical protein
MDASQNGKTEILAQTETRVLQGGDLTRHQNVP